MRIAPRCFVLLLWSAAAAFCAPVDPVFAAIEPSLKAKSAIPVLLPQTLPDLASGKDRIYAIVEKASRTRYRIILAFTPVCNGASFCRLGMLEGMAGRSPALKGKPVQLAHGIHAFFTEGTCGAGCTDSVIAWRQGSATYSAGLKAAQLADVIPLANAITRAGMR